MYMYVHIHTQHYLHVCLVCILLRIVERAVYNHYIFRLPTHVLISDTVPPLYILFQG